MSQSLRGYSNCFGKQNAELFVNVFKKAATFIAKLIQLYTRIPLLPYSVEEKQQGTHIRRNKELKQLISMWLLNKRQTPHKRTRQSN